MKSDYEQTLDKNFNKAFALCNTKYSNKELIEFLKKGNIPEKQFAALELSELSSKDEAEIFLSNLINCDGKIREAIAQKFLEFAQNENYRVYFSNYPDIFAKSTIDINANIARMVIDGLSLMKEIKNFGIEYSNQLITYINDALEELDKIIYKDKKYTINKQLFKLYWCLEGLNNYIQYQDKQVVCDILKKTLKQNEYTIREKVAQILVNHPTEIFLPITEELNTDNNYYVKRVLNKNNQ